MTADAAQLPDPPDLHCPLCRYSLRGLPREPAVRCPECGHGIDWDELTRTATEPPWLIEYARRRLTLAGFLTALRTLHPPSFWRSVPTTLQPVAGRLIGYVAATLVMQVLLVLLVTVGSIATYYASAVYPVSEIVRAFFTTEADTLAPALLPAVWALLNIPALLLFSQTMRRAGVSWHRVLRCVAYAATPWWIVTIYPAIVVVTWAERVPEAVALVLIVGGVGSTTLLALAYRRHLRFPAAWTTVLLAQVVAVLTAVNLLILIVKLTGR